MSDKQDLDLSTQEKKVSFGFGWQFGSQLLKNNFDGLDIDTVLAAIRACYNREAFPLTEQELDAAYSEIDGKRRAEQAEKMKQLAELGEKFLAENAQREGVQVTESGVQYEVLEEGAGDKPGPTDKVRTHYHGTFINGAVFDSSVNRGEPAEFGVNQVIPGWTEILQMMPAGSKWRIAVPHNLAYGEAGSPPVIPPKSVLVFEIHLIEVL
ncbi:FKBP-type peptidyl-prolyl cis-trans isomerase [Oleiphilus messinensis]|uniref:Peptidyl-prolyl cis-trans isomerase n=1 Tax=Oleiphilus messinensis TaxID=141451 RepID=A0A1Y0IBC4_9GAMM|nr:FKBP-type peptidyl-prolyl cis-trans isomerase [Oleiphilus messinensis]ARU57807.1 FKBP-type peptidyl-prolyl cis-trans isomerase [Oleiphilus messinensis]